MVLEIDIEKRRISLGMKQCIENPWLKFAESHSLGDKVKGEVSSLTDFGMFVSLEGGIDGLIHLSDLSWTESEQDAVKNYSKGQSVEAVILAMDAHKERISMGIKQLTEDVFETFATENPKGSQINGVIEKVEEDFVLLKIKEEVFGKLKLKEFKDEEAKVGESISAQITSIDKKERFINLSIRALEKSEEKNLLKENIKKNKEIEKSTKTSIGDLIKDEIGESSSDEDEKV